MLSAGVLQGSFLVALLFLIYVNDFYKCNDALSIVYLDDTSCLFKHKDMHILRNLKLFMGVRIFFSSELAKILNIIYI